MLKRFLMTPALVIILTACGESSRPANEITLEASDFTYSLPSITVKTGEPVVMTLINTGQLEHDFVIDKINAKTKVVQQGGLEAHGAHGAEANYDLHFSAQVGETTIVEFTVAEPGTYQFFCSIPGHKEAGMVGDLIVEAGE
jgi:uncharacterized cupredoxin-like copper-binding protein